MSLSEKLCRDMLDKFLSDVSKIFFNPESQTTLILTTAVVTTVVILSCCKMDLMRFIQDYKGQTNAENKEKLKEIYRQKDELIKKLEIKVHDLECKLKTRNPSEEKEKDTLRVLRHYEDLIGTVMTDNDIIRNQNTVLKQQVSDLEGSLKELMEKYEKAKTTIQGLKDNESSLRALLKTYDKLIKEIEEKYLLEKKRNKIEIGDCCSKESICKKPQSGRV